MNGSSLRPAEEVKFDLLATGIAIDDSALAYIERANGDRVLTPADYASTSGIILRLDGAVWVNAPIATYNPNFVTAPSLTLTASADGLQVVGGASPVGAEFWLPPAYHSALNSHGEAHAIYAFTHGDRVRIAPVTGCAFTCKFCNLPYDYRYRRKDLEGLIEAVEVARADPIQPARHVLISGGTPRPEDFGFLRDVYDAVIESFPDLPVDIMMVPIEEVLDVDHLAAKGVNELSINLELYNDEIARRVMPRKYQQGREHLLEFVARAAEALGPGKVRSMLMVGIEPMEDTLAGVEAVVEAGCIPVLSPFRPDPSTPMRDSPTPTATVLRETYRRAMEIAASGKTSLGPSCPPCSHNTLTFPQVPVEPEHGYREPHTV
jgi:hypothetical protein